MDSLESCRIAPRTHQGVPPVGSADLCCWTATADLTILVCTYAALWIATNRSDYVLLPVCTLVGITLRLEPVACSTHQGLVLLAPAVDITDMWFSGMDQQSRKLAHSTGFCHLARSWPGLTL